VKPSLESVSRAIGKGADARFLVQPGADFLRQFGHRLGRKRIGRVRCRDNSRAARHAREKNSQRTKSARSSSRVRPWRSSRVRAMWQMRATLLPVGPAAIPRRRR